MSFRRFALAFLMTVGAAAGSEDRWLAGDLHTHSTYSTDAAALGGDGVARCLRLAERQRLDFVSITDHHTVAAQADPAFVSAQLTPVPGQEWGTMGHAGVHGSMRLVPEVDTTRPPATWNGQVDRTLALARARGAVVVLNHPAIPEIAWAWTTSAFDAVEIWNVGWSFPFPRPTSREHVEWLLRRRGLADVPGSLSAELAEALSERSGGFNAQGLRFWEAHLARGMKVAVVGGGDRHVLLAPGYPTTWVRARDRALPTLLDAIRAGRTCVTRSPLVRPPDISVASGSMRWGLGDSMPVGLPVRVTVRAAVARRGLVVVYRGRDVLAATPVTREAPVVEVADRPTSPTWYRAEVLEPVLELPLTAAQRALWRRMELHALVREIGEPIEASDGARLPSFRIPDALNRLMNADPKRRGWCKSAITGAIHVR